MTKTALRAAMAGLVAVVALAAPALAQPCEPRWIFGRDYLIRPPSGGSGSGVIQSSIVWDSDGPGPATPRLIVGGDFFGIGGSGSRGIAAYDPATGVWTPLGSGMGSGPTFGPAVVFSLATLPDGSLVAAGVFSTAGGVPANRIARWDGSAWSPLGTGLAPNNSSGANPGVYALLTLPNGDLLAGGEFTRAGGIAVRAIARWNGTAWTPLNGTGSGVPGAFPTVLDLALLPDGRVAAAGYFDTVVGGYDTVTIWDGSEWTPVGSCAFGTNVEAVLAEPDGSLIAGGNFNAISGVLANSVARWDGTTWSPIGEGVPFRVRTLTRNGAGLIAAGQGGAARWDGSKWIPFGPDGLDAYTASTLPDGRLAAAGGWTPERQFPMILWDGASWQSAFNAIDRDVWAILPLPDGSVALGGDFANAGGIAASGIVRWDGARWRPFGEGLQGRVTELAVLADPALGDALFAARADAPEGVMRWDGSAWSSIGPAGGFVKAMAAPVGGGLVAAVAPSASSTAQVLRWDGSLWAPLGTPAAAGDIRDLLALPSGEILAGGRFTAPGAPQGPSSVARWNGTAWSYSTPLPDATVTDLARLADGGIVAVGSVSSPGSAPSAGFVARWDGSSWIQLPGLFTSSTGPDIVDAVAVLPDGSIVVGGPFTAVDGLPIDLLARWDGTAWNPLNPGLSGPVRTLALLPAGELLIGGELNQFGSLGPFARYSLTGIPWTAEDPRPASVRATAAAAFAARPASGYGAPTASWELETAPGSGTYAPLPDGPIPGTASAAASTQPAPLPPFGVLGPATLTIANASPALADRRVRAVLSGPCGSSASAPALLTVAGTPSCYPDCDGSGGSPALSALDLSCFLARYQAAQRLPEPDRALHYANCDGSTTLPALNALDFACFLARYRAGCP